MTEKKVDTEFDPKLWKERLPSDIGDLIKMYVVLNCRDVWEIKCERCQRIQMWVGTLQVIQRKMRPTVSYAGCSYCFDDVIMSGQPVLLPHK